MKKYSVLIILVLAMAVVGCSSTLKALKGDSKNFYRDKQGNEIEITSPKEQCVLYRILGTDTTYYRIGLFTANYAALKTEFYTPQDAEAVLNDIEEELDSPSATVGSFITKLLAAVAKARKAGAPEIIAITSGLEEFAGSTAPIDDCTWYKLKVYIAKQKTLVYSFKE